MKKIMIAMLILFIFAPVYAAGKYAVQGTVLFADGTPAAGFSVQLLEKKAKRTLLHGTVRIAQNGTYQITYSPRRSLKSMTIFVRVLDGKGRQVYKSTSVQTTKFIEIINVKLP
jgi:5-hydroxyisourate hydrolase-like protein (transthyretin family)